MVSIQSSLSSSPARHAAAARQGGCNAASNLLKTMLAFVVGFLIGARNRSTSDGGLHYSLLMGEGNLVSIPDARAAAMDGDGTSTAEHPRLSAAFETQHAVHWTIPSDIATERHAECSDGKKISSTGGFCLTEKKNIGGNYIYDRDLALFLANNVVADHTVVDLGAGLGHYGTIFREPNSRVRAWVGYDGAINVEKQTDGMVKFMDLTQPHASDERPCVAGDWVLSLEVAEHIPVKHTDDYLRNVRCHARVGAVVSWGRPEQTGGLGHVNTKTEEAAIAAVERWGFTVDWELTKRAREAAKLSHFKKTVVVYRIV